MAYWKDEMLNKLYRHEQMDRAQKAREARDTHDPDQHSESGLHERDRWNEFRAQFTRKQSR